MYSNHLYHKKKATNVYVTDNKGHAFYHCMQQCEYTSLKNIILFRDV